MDFNEQLVKLKISLDHFVSSFSNSYKVMFVIDKLNINVPKNICEILNMAKSNLAIIAGKLRLLRLIDQNKADNNKQIVYSLTAQGKAKLDDKLKSLKISPKDKQQLLDIIGQL